MKRRKHIVLLGCPAVGKLTTAMALAKRINYPIFDNSKVVDIVSLLYRYGTREHKFYRNELRFDFYRRAALCDTINGLISTNVLRNTSNWEHFHKIKKDFDACGWETIFVILKADENIILERVEEASRLKKVVFHHAPDLIDWFLRNKDHSNPCGNDVLVIDNSNVSEEQVTNIIIKRIGCV